MAIFKKKNKTVKTKIENEILTLEQLEERIESKKSVLFATTYAECVVVDFIAKEFAKCHVNFYNKDQELQIGENYYNWNCKPNNCQNAYEFKYDYAKSLLINGEALIFEKREQYFVADSFNKKTKGCFGIGFSNVSKFGETFLDFFNNDQVIYTTYDQLGMRAYISSLMSELQVLLSATAKIQKKSSLTKGMIELDTYEFGDTKKMEEVRKYISNTFSEFFTSDSDAIMPIFKGMKYVDTNNNRDSVKKSEVSDVQSLIDTMIAKAAIARGVSPSAILGDKENTALADKNTISRAIKPIAEVLEEGLNASIIGLNDYISGNYVDVDLSPLTYSTVFDNAEPGDILIRSSTMNPDESRIARGLRPRNTWYSKSFYTTKNYEALPENKPTAKEVSRE